MTRNVRRRVPQYLLAFDIKPSDIDATLDAMIADDANEKYQAQCARAAMARRKRHQKSVAKRERILLAAADARTAAKAQKPATAQMRGSGAYCPKDGIAGLTDRLLCGMAPGTWHTRKALVAALGKMVAERLPSELNRYERVERRKIDGQVCYRLTAAGEAERAKREKLVAERIRAREEGRELDLRFKSQRDAITGELSGTRIKRWRACNGR